jgi:hypothetical protein
MSVLSHWLPEQSRDDEIILAGFGSSKPKRLELPSVFLLVDVSIHEFGDGSMPKLSGVSVV